MAVAKAMMTAARAGRDVSNSTVNLDIFDVDLNFKCLTETESHSVREERKSKGQDAAGSKPGQEDGKLAAPGAQKDATALSMQSGMSSSLVETSEDEEAKRKEAEKAARAARKGLDEDELDADVDVVIEETETIMILTMPSQVVAAQTSGDADNEEIAQVDAAIKRYDAFLENKKGSDNYTERGSQTMNLTQKTREVSNKGFSLEHKEIQASWWDIFDSQQ